LSGCSPDGQKAIPGQIAADLKKQIAILRLR
jgi:hypothetical protein